MKLNKFGYLTLEGLRSIFTHGFMSFASVTIIVACLIIMGSFALLAINIDAAIDELANQNEIVAYIDESYSEEDARALGAVIEALPNVSYIEFVTREEALESFSEKYEEDLFESIEPDVLRHRYVIYLDDIELMNETQAALKEIPGLSRVDAYLEIARGFVTVRNVISALSLVLVIILVVVSVFIMANTIKLASFGRREEIAIMKMVGASNSFIRFPFIVEGLILGLAGAGISFGLQWVIYNMAFEKIMNSVAGDIINVVAFDVLMLPVLAVFLVIGLFVGTFGGVIAIRNYLKV